ncbi:carbamoyltransferase C-terminal domain-containing protein [Acidobacteriota bacterium]
MKILGISELDNDAGAVLLDGAVLMGAVNEERFSRIKRHCGFPFQSIAWLLKKAGIKAKELHAVVIVKNTFEEEMRRYKAPLRKHQWFNRRFAAHECALNWLAYKTYKVPKMRSMVRTLDKETNDWLEWSGVSPRKVFRIDHHRAHAASAYFASGFKRALAVTVDGQGAGVSASVYKGENGRLERLQEIYHPNSMGVFYAAATKALGFTPAKHEGKVTGLAGYGPPDAEALDMCRQLAFNTGGRFETPCLYGAFPRMKRVLKRCGRVPFAAAFQQVLEEVVCAFIRPYLDETGLDDIVLAGGVFANVKLNQRVKEIDGIKNIFVFPHMCDGGLGFGGAFDYLSREQRIVPTRIQDVYWGPAFTDWEMRTALKRSGLYFKMVDDQAAAIAQLLADGRLVARFNGALEFGPRALGNRSILYHTTDPSVNDWLNDKLERSEFMPFAPITLPEHAAGLFEGLEGGEFPAEFMTITFNCTDRMRKLSPAVVHEDGTARPQIVNPNANRDMYNILEKYHALTGIPSVVNTSFNMHEEPIVRTPREAIQAFLQARLDCLSLGPFLAAREENKGLLE